MFTGEICQGACIVKFEEEQQNHQSAGSFLSVRFASGGRLDRGMQVWAFIFLWPVARTLTGLFLTELLHFRSDTIRDGFLRYVPCFTFINKESSFFTWLCGQLMELDATRAWCVLGMNVFRRRLAREGGLPGKF